MEVFELTGKPISSMQEQWQGRMQRHPARWFGLDWDRDALNRRINARVKQMIADGWVEETRGLLDRFGELSKTAAEATGYHELIEHVRGAHVAGRCGGTDQDRDAATGAGGR